MLNSNSILLPTRVVFFLKLTCNQSTEDIRCDAFRYCYKNGLHSSGFFRIKEGLGMPEENYIRDVLANVSRKCQMDMDVILYTNSELPCLDHFPLVRRALIDGVLTICHWNCYGKIGINLCTFVDVIC